MAEHVGGKNIGGPTIATGNQQKLFDGMPALPGEVLWVDILLAFTLISTGAAFLSSNPTGAARAARGADDADKVLDFIFKSLTMRADERSLLFDGETASVVRAVLSFLTGQDVGLTGAMVNGASIPVSTGAAVAGGIRLRVPLSLKDELLEADGDAYRVGTNKFKMGGFFPNIQNTGGTVALVNGSATLAGLAISLIPHVDPNGDPTYSGPTYKIQTNANLISEVTTLPRAKRLLLLVDGVAGGPYTVRDEAGGLMADALDAASLVDGFNQNRRARGGDNSCSKMVPLIFPRRKLTLHEMDFTPGVPYVKDTSSPASQTLVSVLHQPEDAQVSARLQGEAKLAAGGATVQRYTPIPPSAAGHGTVHPRNASLLGGGFVKARPHGK